MVKSGLIGVIFSIFAITSEGARFDTEHSIQASHSRSSVDLLKYAHTSNKYGMHRSAVSSQRVSRAAVSVSARGTVSATSSSTTTSDLTPMVQSFYDCTDSSLVPGGCPTDAASLDAVCASQSVIVPGLTKAAFCPVACNSCEWYIQPRGAADVQIPYCLTGSLGGMQRCIYFSDGLDLKLRPREANGKIYFSIISSQNNFCLQDLSAQMKADKTIVTELTKLAAAQEETDEQTDLDKTLQDASESTIDNFGPCILGKYEERQQWQLIPTGVPGRSLVRNRRTNKCLHFKTSTNAAPGDAPFASASVAECVGRMNTNATAFYNQAVIISPKPLRYTLQQVSGSMRCVAAPALGATKPASTLNGADCLLTPEQGRHVFNLIPAGSCINRAVPLVDDSSTGRMCPYQLQLDSGVSTSSTRQCMTAVVSTNSTYVPTVAACTAMATTSDVGVTSSYAQTYPTLRQAWWLRESDTNYVNKFQLRWMDSVGGRELCLNYAPTSQGNAGVLTDCASVTNPTDWYVKPYVSADSTV